MGAELIGYMLYGPREISDGQKDLAYSRALKTSNLIKFWLEYEGDKPDGLDHLEQDESWEVEYFADLSFDDAKKTVDTFIEFWNNPYSLGFYDVITRIIENYRVVFAGDSTWGDEPNGGGYDLINEARMLGILEPLGIV